jgi:Peptidase family M23
MQRSAARHALVRVGVVVAVAVGMSGGSWVGISAAVTVQAVSTVGVAAAAAPAHGCKHPAPPDWFHDSLVTAIGLSGDLPADWADAPEVAKIACWQGAGYDVAFDAKGDAFHEWHGLFAMTIEEVQTIAGPWMLSDKNGLRLDTTCFVWGWARCSRTPGNSRIVQQDIAALRWIWLNYGDPATAWQHIGGTGRFDSYPRPGTDDTPTTTPLALCPVAGTVSYVDDFGRPRYVGGYHPHWGNDIHAPEGREIRAPFDGLAVAHSDDWFAGNYVTVVGAKGYVRNGHMVRFGTLGYVTAGTVIGYVGETGDATSTHDHFEWHPWVVATPLHKAPSGFTRVMDAIDPFPFLGQVCGAFAGGPQGGSGAVPAGGD